MNPQKLVYMANQIGKFFAVRGEDAAVLGVLDHLQRFWDPRMRAAIIAYAESGGAGLDAAVAKAVARLASERP
ncbi:MAG: formate dehydrogenase subunit delta [Hyphomonadaceae bacterium]|nr:MAG: formate dehydrogenase delta subunit [Caulobacteraceae bacterium]MBT9447196.1 formate dehydrogenase subunit delta [Hyphomonadaceae bacterium]TPW08219.1 MAG: formate dehydrogenase, delta subunit [Alphaproteobacteria bacterium]